MKRPIPRKWIIVLAIAFVALLACAYAGRHLLTDSPFQKARVFDGPSGVFSGESGRVYVIDDGKKSVLILNARGELERQITGGHEEGGFYYASLVAEGGQGEIYLADTLYSGEGTRLAAERIFRYDADGRNPELVYQIDYTGVEKPPMQYGWIKSLRVEDGRLVFSVKTQEGVDVRTYDPASGAETTASYSLPGVFLFDADVRYGSLLPVYVTMLGEVCAIDESGAVRTLVGVEDGKMPWRVCAGQDALYYTDLSQYAMLRLDPDTGEESPVFQGEGMLYTAFETGGRLYTTDYAGYYTYADGQARYFENAPLGSLPLRTAVWAAVALAGILGVLILLMLLWPVLRRKKSATFQRVMIVLLVAGSIATLVSYVTLNETVQNQNDLIMEQLNLFADVMVQSVNVEEMVKIQQVQDYQGPAYRAVKEPLDALMDMTYDNGLYYYYAIYVGDGEMIYGMMDYEETTTTRQPMYPWGTEGYTEVLADGATVEYRAEVSSFGSWAFVLKPVLDREGNPVAVMDVGTNLDDLNAQNRALMVQVLLVVAAMAVVLLMFIIETLLYIEHRENKRALTPLSHVSGRFPLRTLIFLAFLADCMQDAFVSILSNQLYTPVFGIPQSVGAALPLSAQVLMAALFAFAGGGLVRGLGVRKVLCAGFLIQLCGSLMCAIVPSYFGLLGGKMLIGAGLGMVTVSVNAVAAFGGDEQASARAFTAVNAGTLVGVTAGAGIGSLILSFGNARAVYYASAIILGLGLLLAVTGSDHREPKAERERRKGGALRFLMDRQVVTFLLLILMPFLMAISFREYFFPLFASEMGVSEADIGRIYLVCGLVVIYAGPGLTKNLIGRWGSKVTVLLASALICAATLLFAFIPTFTAALVGLALLSLSISFGYAAQSTYYSSLPGVARFGESRAMGVYSLFDNGGQTLGPVIYGLAMLLGRQAGLYIIGLALAGLMLLFLAVNHKKTHASHTKGEENDVAI